MKYKSEKNAMDISKKLIDEFLVKGDIALDATIGNGNDTLLICKKVGSKGKVYGFDIQEIAIKNTKDLLTKENLIENVQLINDSHENIDKHISENIDFAIYNLGYLPGGDKTIKTNANSSVISIEKTLEILNLEGILIITVYTGHSGGIDEKLAIEEVLVNLDQRQFSVLKYEFINQRNNPPLVYRIEKIKL